MTTSNGSAKALCVMVFCVTLMQRFYMCIAVPCLGQRSCILAVLRFCNAAHIDVQIMMSFILPLEHILHFEQAGQARR